jgi:protease-4
VQRGRNANIFDVTRPRSEEQIERLRQQVQLIYADFVRKVAESRGLTEQEIEPVAQGRVWSGAAALRCGLIDALGSLQSAVERAAARAGLRPGEGVTVEVSLASAPWARWFAAVPPDSPLDFLHRGQLWCPIQASLR